jgi:hypothetical protein
MAIRMPLKRDESINSAVVNTAAATQGRITSDMRSFTLGWPSILRWGALIRFPSLGD